MRVIDMAIDHRVTMTMPITEAIIRPPGIVAGQAQMAFIDTAALMVCWSVMGEFGDCTTVSQDNHFLRAAQGGQLVARARPRKAGRQLVFIDVELFVDSGMEPVTSAAVIYMRL